MTDPVPRHPDRRVAAEPDAVTLLDRRIVALTDDLDGRATVAAIGLALGAITAVLIGLAFPWQQVVDETIVTARPGYAASPATAVCAGVALIAFGMAWIRRELYAAA